MISKHEADRLLEALQRIEEGNVYIGASILRSFLREVGYPAPLFVVQSRQPMRGADPARDT